ncbi:hypothetical protein F5Y08DRAFT_208761 [Xylaria arbuscula]|nr:hypothetical protein F5Y08DRAFT_208761 [Xylaria arbuscula]
MAYSNEISVALPPTMRGIAGGLPKMDMAKPQPGKSRHRTHPKSQPFDPEDLRRRLYVVIAEREAQGEKRTRQHVDSMPAKWAQVERERDMQHLYIEHLAATTTTTWMPEVTAPPRRPSTTVPKSRLQQSIQDKIHKRNSMIAAPSELPNPDTTECAKYRHIPDQAAAQFSRTTTQGGMQDEKSAGAVHSLSRAALRLYVEGTSSADRSAIDSSITPGKQRKIMQRAQSQRDKQHGRNQFQESRLQDEGARRRSSKAGLEKTRTTEEERKGSISALADLHLHAYPSQGETGADNGGGNNNNNGVHSSEETLVDTATANEHRVDWTQSDEMLPHERSGAVKFLRKTTSILTLKGKLGHLRRNSNGDSTSPKEGGGGDGVNNNLRIMTIQEAHDEQAEADADDGSTPMSPQSGTSSGRSARTGLWGRLKRG